MSVDDLKTMTAAEFKAWFDGFGEAIGDAPTPEQWKRVKEKVKRLGEPLRVSHGSGLPTWVRAMQAGSPLPPQLKAYCSNSEVGGQFPREKLD